MGTKLLLITCPAVNCRMDSLAARQRKILSQLTLEQSLAKLKDSGRVMRFAEY